MKFHHPETESERQIAVKLAGMIMRTEYAAPDPLDYLDYGICWALTMSRDIWCPRDCAELLVRWAREATDMQSGQHTAAERIKKP